MKIPWMRNLRGAGWLFGAGIPAAILISTWLVATSIEKSKLNTEYVRIALGVLVPKRDDTGSELSESFSKDEMAMRGWAVRLLNKNSPEKFTEDEQNALLDRGFYSTGWGGDTPSYFYSYTPVYAKPDETQKRVPEMPKKHPTTAPQK